MTRPLFAMLLAGALAGFGQQQPADAIPKDLVKLLIGSMYGPSADIVIGLPAGFPQELLPRDSVAKISTVFSTNMMVIVEAPTLPAELSQYERQLANGGWTPAPAGMSGGRGLLSAPPARAPLMLCNGDRYATYSLTPRPAGGSYARISVSTPARPGPPCQPSGPGAYASMSLSGEIELPAFLPPTGSRTTYGSGGGGGTDYFEQSLRLQTTMPVAEVLQHYRAQAEKHGWKFESQAVAESVGVARFSLLSTKKEPVAATILISIVPGDHPMDIVLRLARASTRPRTP